MTSAATVVSSCPVHEVARRIWNWAKLAMMHRVQWRSTVSYPFFKKNAHAVFWHRAKLRYYWNRVDYAIFQNFCKWFVLLKLLLRHHSVCNAISSSSCSFSWIGNLITTTCFIIVTLRIVKYSCCYCFIDTWITSYFNSTLVKASPPSEASAGLDRFTSPRSDFSQLRTLVRRTPFVP